MGPKKAAKGAKDPQNGGDMVNLLHYIVLCVPLKVVYERMQKLKPKCIN
jgi:hypothetical protein